MSHMDTLRIDICYRPLRVGWAVRRGDFESLRRIVRWSHTLSGGRHNPIIVVDDADYAKRIVETFRVDVVWSVGDDESVRTFPTRFPYLISPFYDEALTVSGMHEHQAQFLDIHNYSRRDGRRWSHQRHS